MNKKSFIVVLKGVNKNDLNLDKKMKENFVNSLETFKENIQTLPNTYYTPDKWIKTTKLKCWECGDNFNNIPAFLPDNPEIVFKEGRKVTNYEVKGVFCCWGCVARYIYANVHEENKRIDMLRWAITIKNQFTGKNDIRLEMAPHKSIMEEYCGEDGINKNEFKERKLRTNL